MLYILFLVRLTFSHTFLKTEHRAINKSLHHKLTQCTYKRISHFYDTCSLNMLSFNLAVLCYKLLKGEVEVLQFLYSYTGLACTVPRILMQTGNHTGRHLNCNDSC